MAEGKNGNLRVAAIEVQDVVSSIESTSSGFASLLAFHGNGISEDQLPALIAAFEGIAEKARDAYEKCAALDFSEVAE